MTCQENLETYLRRNEIPFRAQWHPVAYTAREVATATGAPGRSVAKAVLVVADGELAMFVLPGTYRLDLRAVASLLDADEARLAKEREFAGRLADCEVGATPPFGNRYGLPVYVDPALAMVHTIVFPAGRHTAILAVAYADFARLVHPQVARVAYYYGDDAA